MLWVLHLCCVCSHLYAVEAAAIVNLKEGKRSCARFSASLDPAPHAQGLADLRSVRGVQTGPHKSATLAVARCSSPVLQSHISTNQCQH